MLNLSKPSLATTSRPFNTQLIAVLQRHRDLKRWVMAQLRHQWIACQETYGNDENGDIKIIDPAATQNTQAIIDEIHQRFNASAPEPSYNQAGKVNCPHIEVKTQYLYGQEATTIIMKGTIIGIASAHKISQPSQIQLRQAGITFAECIPPSAFSP